MSHFPPRIVSLQPSATVTLHALGLLDLVVACTKYCADVVPEVADGKRLIVHDSWTAQAAQILAAKPDLVIASVPYQEKAVVEILKAGLPFLALSPHSLADVYSDMAMIAGVVGAPERADQLIGEMQAEIEAVRKRMWHRHSCCHAAEGRASAQASHASIAKSGASRLSILSYG